jgi:hypothetical protein
VAIAGINGDRETLERLGVEYADAELKLDEAYELWNDLNGQIESVAVTASSS